MKNEERMSIYTEEELNSIGMSIEDYYDDDIDYEEYDEYDEYYDDSDIDSNIQSNTSTFEKMGLSKRSQVLLKSVGIKEIRHLYRKTVEDLMQIPGMDQKSIQEIKGLFKLRNYKGENTKILLVWFPSKYGIK